MNKTELVAAIADKAEISKKDSEKAKKLLLMQLQKNLRKVIRFSQLDSEHSRQARELQEREEIRLQGRQ